MRIIMAFWLLLAPAAHLHAQTAALPSSAWEQHPEGISLAVTLTAQLPSGAPGSAIVIYLKNTSTTEWDVMNGEVDHGVEIYYLDGNGVRTPLHNYPADAAARSLKMRNLIVKPDQVTNRAVNLTPAELETVKSHPVVCRIRIFSPSAAKLYTIESKPKTLVAGP